MNSFLLAPRDPKIIDPITAFVGYDAPVHRGGHRQCRDSKFLPTVAEVREIGSSATPKRYAVAPLGTSAAVSSLPIAIATVRKEEPLEVRQAVAERIQGRAHRITASSSPAETRVRVVGRANNFINAWLAVQQRRFRSLRATIGIEPRWQVPLPECD
jgi:hypothetical protein